MFVLPTTISYRNKIAGLIRFGTRQWGWFSASKTGVLAYRAAGAEGSSQLVWRNNFV